MIERKIGEQYASTYDKIAKYFESATREHKKADKVYRVGQENLKDNEKELKNLQFLY